MITIDKEYFSSPYYFLMRDKGNHYSLYFSVEPTLTEARKKDEMIKIPKEKVQSVIKYLESIVKNKTKKNTKDVKGEIEELVTSDGTMSNSKIPILDPRLHPKRTMDQTVAASRITNDPISRGYRTYYGESIEEAKNDKKKTNKKIVYVAKEKNSKPLTISKDDLEKYVKEPKKLLSKLNKAGFNLGSGHEKIEFIKRADGNYVFYGITYYGAPEQSVTFNKKIVNEGEIEETDMSSAFGYEETKDLDGKTTYKYFKDKLDMEPEEARERTKQQGKDPSGKKDKKKKPGSLMRLTISEIQKQKAIKMLEDILMKGKNQEKSDVVTKKEEEKEEKQVPSILKKQLNSLIRQAEKQGLSKKDISKLLDSE